MDAMHWVCPGCGVADGPISENVCDVCAEQFEERREVERLVPADQLREAVEVLRQIATHDVRATEGGVLDGYAMQDQARAYLRSIRRR